MAHNGETTMAEEGMKALVEENKRLRVYIAECTSAMFARLPENRVSDASISREYEYICEAIEAWMDNAMADYKKGDFKRHYKHMLRAGKGRPILKQICQDFLDPS